MDRNRFFDRSGILGVDLLGGQGVELEINLMGYPFICLEAFSPRDSFEEALGRFKTCVGNIAFALMKKWVNQDSKGGKAKGGDPMRSIFDFQTSTTSELERIFDMIVGGEDNASKLVIPIGNAKLKFKRFGDRCLGIRILGNNGGGDEIHVDGTRIMKESCADGSVPYLREFVHSVGFRILLPRGRGQNNSIIVDFYALRNALATACPYFNWVKPPALVHELSKQYINPPQQISFLESMVKVGDFYDLSIIAGLFHYREDLLKNNPQWRCGNHGVLEGSEGSLTFADGNDLCLSLAISGGLPQSTFLKSVDITLGVEDQQQRLLEAAAMFYFQLCAMQKTW